MLGQWRKDSVANPWLGRDGAGLLELDGNLYMLGGWNTAFAAPYTSNEVWMRPKGSQTWQKLSNAPWAPRHTAGWLVHNKKLWVIGGDANSGVYQRDVWCGTPFQGGVRWSLVTASAPWASPGRVLHIVFSFLGKIVVLGGQTLDELVPIAANKANRANPYYDDIWTSDDEGVTWVQVSTGQPWAPCGMLMGSPVKDGCMWLIGGGAYDTSGLPRVYKNSIWKSSNITDWEEVTPAAAFPARQYNAVGVLGDRLVTSCGWNGANISDLWSSVDGENWKEHRGNPLSPRHALSLCQVKGELLVLGGTLTDLNVYALS